MVATVIGIVVNVIGVVDRTELLVVGMVFAVMGCEFNGSAVSVVALVVSPTPLGTAAVIGTIGKFGLFISTVNCC